MYKNLLQIDDDPDDCELFCDALNEVCDIKYTCIHDPVTAIAQLTELKVTPDIIILDLNMPVMNGIEVLTKIKKEKKIADIPVVIFSTSCDKENKREAMACGAMACIVKPTSYAALKELIEKYINKLN
jgi:CheY-like chemotaxis protein